MNYRIAMIACLLWPLAVVGQQPNPSEDAKAARAAESRKLAKDLGDPNKAVQDAAMAKIKELLLAEVPPGQAPPALTVPLWHRSLLKVHRYDDAEFVAYARILTVPWNSVMVANMQRLRVEGFLAANKPEAALSAAKGYFNVTRVRETPAAVELVSKALAAARPGDKDVAERFRLQQSSNSTTQPVENLLASIKVDAAVFDEAIGVLVDQEFNSLMAKGNLQLICDRPKEARTAFDAALAKATDDNQKQLAHQGIARVLKAEAGSAGPGNDYLVKLKLTE